MYDRNKIIERLKSRRMTAEEFNFEALTAPPLYSMFTPEDINRLHDIATSLEYADRLKEKYAAIDEIMTNRGFKKLVAGTNRVTYEPLFANNFVVKVAYDSVAINDSIREFYNQNILKPFCTRVFEVSKCGTVGIFERVNPVTCKKEFISMAADIFLLVSEFIIGKYVVDDIGTHYYQNYGVRYGFGPVLLDFPYVYEVDPKKIYCNKPDPNDPTGYCNGPIDYDAGYNKLMCKKCGATYAPYEVAKKMEYNNFEFVRERKESKMIVKISGGSRGKSTFEKRTNDFKNPVVSLASNLLNKKVEKIKAEEAEKKAAEVAEETVVEEAPKTVNGIEEPVVEEKLEVTEEKKVIQPVTFDENIKGKKEDPGYADEKANTEFYMSKINNIYNYSDTTDEEKEKIVKTIVEFIKDILVDNIDIAIELISYIFRKKKYFDDSVIKSLLDKNSTSVNDQFIRLLLTSDKYHAETEVVELITKENNTVVKTTTEIYNNSTDKSIISIDEDADIPIECLPTNIPDIEPDENVSESVDEEIDFYASEDATEYDDVSAVTVARNDLFADESSEKVIVIRNNNGKYLTINGKIIGIDKIDNRNIDDSILVPIKWYEDSLPILNAVKQAPVGSLPEEEAETEGEE